MLSCRTLGQRGMTLVELLVAMVISLVLLGGVYQMFVGSTTSNRENEQFARLQENARFAMEILGRDLRMAGYTGCAGGDLYNNLDDTDPAYVPEFHDLTVAVQGNNANAADWTPPINAAVIVGAVAGSDIITVRTLDPSDEILITGNNANAANLQVVSRTSIDAGEVVIVSDCVAGDIFQVTNNNIASTLAHGVTNDPGNKTPNLSKGYDAGAQVYRFRSMIFLIRNNLANPPLPSLFRLRWDGPTGAIQAEELVQGVEMMQIRYGIDTNADRQVDSYVTAAGAAADWSQVVAVRVALLLQSDINARLPEDTVIYDLDGDGGGDYDPIDDRRMRRVFKSTFTLRNRVP